MDCHEADHDWLTRGRDCLNLCGQSPSANCAKFEIKMDDQLIGEFSGLVGTCAVQSGGVRTNDVRYQGQNGDRHPDHHN